MQRITINLDLNNNQCLTEEIDKAIEGAVKARCREVFNTTFEKEIDRIVQNRLSDLERKTYWGPGKLQKMVNEKVDKKFENVIEEYIGNIKIPTSLEIRKQVENKMKSIEEKIDYSIQIRLNEINFEDLISRKITEIVKKELPEQLFTLLIGRLKEER